MKNNRKIFVVFALSLVFCLLFATSAFAEAAEEGTAAEFAEESAAEDVTYEEEALPEIEDEEPETVEETPEIMEEAPEADEEPAGEDASFAEMTEADDPSSADGDNDAAEDAEAVEKVRGEDEQSPSDGSEAEGYISFEGKYSLRLGESAQLAEILDSLGIDIGEGIDAVTCSDPEAIVFDRDGCRIVSTGKVFLDETLYITAGGTEYAIALHDPTEVTDFSKLKGYLQAGAEAEIKLTADIDLSEGIVVYGTKTLDLAGHTLKAVSDGISIFSLSNSDAEFKVIDSSKEKAGKLDGNGKNATIRNPGSLTLSEITVTSIKAGSSSPIYNDTGTLVIDGCTFSDCSGLYGGAVYNNGKAVISDSIFTGCTATRGGALYCDGADLTVPECVFTGCSVVETGGAIAVDMNESGKSTSTILGSTFTGCSAEAGGAIFIMGSNVSFGSGTITGCEATDSEYGGAIYLVDASLSLIVESDKSMRIFGNTSNAKECNVYSSLSPIEVICPAFSEGTRIGFSGNFPAEYSDGCQGIDEWLVEGTGMFFADDPAKKLEHMNDNTEFIIKNDTESGIKLRPQTDDRLTYGDTESKIMYSVSVINGDMTPTLKSTEGYDLELTSANGEYLLTLSLSSAVSAGDHVLRDVVTLSEGTLQNQSVLKYTVVPKELGISWTDGTVSVKLLSAPAEAKFGTVLYSLDGGETWSEDIPEVSEAGEYTVMYMVEGNDSFGGISGSVNVTVKVTEADEDDTAAAQLRYSEGSGKELEIVLSSAAYGRSFTEEDLRRLTVKVDGKVVDPANYSAELTDDGSIRIVFTAEFMRTLEKGTHEVIVIAGVRTACWILTVE